MVRLDTETGAIETAKVPTDYADPVVPMLAGIDLFEGGAGTVRSLRHATTLATNAVIDRSEAADRILDSPSFHGI